MRKKILPDEETILKKQNKLLKREVSRLKKLLNQDLLIVEEKEIQNSLEDKFFFPEEAKCPKCGSKNLGSYTTPTGKKTTACKSCKKYRRID